MNIFFLSDFTNKATQWNKISNIETLPHKKINHVYLNRVKTRFTIFSNFNQALTE